MRIEILLIVALTLLPNLCEAQQNSSRPAAHLASAPAASSAAVKQALDLEQAGKVAEARKAWEQVVKLQPRNGQAFAHLGLLEARAEDYPLAIEHYRKAKALDPKIPQLDLNLGLALFKTGDFAEAGKLFAAELAKTAKSPAGAADPARQRLTILAAMSRYGAHDYAGAIPYLKEAAANDEKNLPLRLALAHSYLWTKQLDATMGVYKEILSIDPDSAEADMIAGEALDEKGDNAGAVAQFKAAAAANPKEPNVHFGLAYLLWAQKRYDEAIAEFKAELANDPKNSQAMIYLGDTYVQQNQFELARPVLEAAVETEERVPLIHLDLGIVYSEMGEREAALRELKKTVSLEPENVNAHFRLAKLYQAAGQRDEAKAEFARASSLNKKTDDSLHKRIADANARPEPENKKSLPEAQPRQP